MKKIHLAPYWEYVKGVGKHDKQSLLSVNNTAVITEEAKLQRIGHDYCFSGMHSDGIKRGWEYILLQLNDEQAYAGGSSKETLHTYYEWLLHYSIFRSVFVSKNLSRILKERVLIIDPNVDARLVINGMVAARMAWEKQFNTSTRIGIWHEMVEMGTDPNQAFALCSSIARQDGLYKMQSNNNHELLDPGSEVMHLNFLQEKLDLNGKSFKELGGYDGITALFKSNREDGFSPWDFINARWNKTVQTTNLFGTPVKAAAPIPKDEFLGIIKGITTDYSSKLKELKINV